MSNLSISMENARLADKHMQGKGKGKGQRLEEKGQTDDANEQWAMPKPSRLSLQAGQICPLCMDAKK